MKTRRLAPLAMLALICTLPALGGCEGSPWFYQRADSAGVDAADYVQGAPLSGTELDELWDRARQVLDAEGYMVDQERTRFGDRMLVSGWNALLAPTRFEGYRTRAWIRFTQPTPKQWQVSVAVQRQRNADIDRPQEGSVAKWEAQPSDASRANLLLWKIESGFRDEIAK